jgi:flagellar hook protein FlgE
MSLYASLLAGVSGLKAQTLNMSTVSDNIANVSTIGYKKSSSAFSTLVSGSDSNGAYAAGGISAAPRQLISQQGILQATQRATDVAIVGAGFFVVSDERGEQLFTRAGSFNENNRGQLQNSSGYLLQGWRVDQAGNVIDPSKIGTVAVSAESGVAADTKNLVLGGNLDVRSQAKTSPINFATMTASAFNLSNAYSISERNFINDFSRTIKVFDSLGNSQNITLNLVKIGGFNDWAFSLASDEIRSFPEASGAAIAPFRQDAVITSGLPFGAFDGGGYQVRLTSGTGAGQVRRITFNTTDTLVTNPIWTVNPDSTTQYVVERADGTIKVAGYGTLSFNGDGSLNQVRMSSTNATPTSVVPNSEGQMIATLPMVWINGAHDSAININFGSFGSSNGFGQFAADFDVQAISRDGAEVGLRTGVRIDDEGFVIASYSNGATQKLWKVPVATFANPNELQARKGSAFGQTTASGEFTLREAGGGGAGGIEPMSLEGSNVDLSDEFSQMITTQRAYTAASKIITTTDELLDELLRIKR